MRPVYTASRLAHLLNGEVHGDPALSIQGVASLCLSDSRQLTFFDNPDFLPLLEASRAAIVLLRREYVVHCPVTSIAVAYPRESFLSVVALFASSLTEPKHKPLIHDSAIIAESVVCGQAVSVGANAHIADHVQLGDQVTIGAGCRIGAGVRIGSGTVLADGVTVHEGTIIGRNVRMESGVVLGAAPFNCVKTHGVWVNELALGGVFIADDVILGANTVIARGTIGDTLIGCGVRIDNLAHIAHDVTIGAHTAIAGAAIIGAFVTTGAHCIIGGGSCLAASVSLADDVVITGMSTVARSIGKPGIYSSGTYVTEHSRWRRNAARFRRLDEYVSRLLRQGRDNKAN